MYFKTSILRKVKDLSILVALLFFFSNSLLAFEPTEGEQNAASSETNATAHHEKEKFNPGKMILEHVLDAYEWHVLTLGEGTEHEKHISISLPVILYSSEKGLSVFSSGNFKNHETHQAQVYNGYKLEEGHIVSEDGSKFIDLSITKTVFAILFSMALICFIFISVARAYTRNKDKAPKGLQSFMEPLILFVRDEVAIPSIGSHHKAEKYLPFLLTIFFFIFLNNLLGLIPFFPGGANVTGNIAVTMVLAVFTFLITSFSANKHYWLHIINTPGVPWWLKFPVPLMPIVEIIGVFSKPFVLMLRLFANITAGHIIALAFFSLIFIFGEMNTGLGYGVSILSVAFTIFMNFLELLVAFLQAYVFTLLSALYIGMATADNHH